MRIEDDLLGFIIQLAGRFGIKKDAAVELYESRDNQEIWIEVAKKHGLY